VTTGVIAAGCGGGSSNGLAGDSAPQIVNATVSAMEAAKSMTMIGTITQNGAPTSVDWELSGAGDIDGTIGVNGITGKLIKIGEVDYLNYPAAYWTRKGAPSADVAELAGKWFSEPDSVEHLGMISIGSLANVYESELGSAAEGVTGTINGQAAVSIILTSGTLWVATSGTAYPLEQVGSPGTGSIAFSGWNEGTEPSAPAGAEPVSAIGSGVTGTGASGAAGISGLAGTTGASGTSGTT